MPKAKATATIKRSQTQEETLNLGAKYLERFGTVESKTRSGGKRPAAEKDTPSHKKQPEKKKAKKAKASSVPKKATKGKKKETSSDEEEDADLARAHTQLKEAKATRAPSGRTRAEEKPVNKKAATKAPTKKGKGKKKQAEEEGGSNTFILERTVKPPLPQDFTPTFPGNYEGAVGAFLADGKRYAVLIDTIMGEDDSSSFTDLDQGYTVMATDRDALKVCLLQVDGVKIALGSSFCAPLSTGPTSRYAMVETGPLGVDLDTGKKFSFEDAPGAIDDVLGGQVVWNPAKEHLSLTSMFGLYNALTNGPVVYTPFDDDECDEEEDDKEENEDGTMSILKCTSGMERGSWSPSGEYIATNEFILRVTELKEKVCNVKKIQSVGGGFGSVVGIAWSPDSTKVALQGSNGMIRLWSVEGDTATSKEFKCPLPLPQHVCTLALSPSDPLLLCGGGACGNCVLNLETGETVATIATSNETTVGAWSYDGSRVLVTTGAELYVYARA